MSHRRILVIIVALGRRGRLRLGYGRRDDRRGGASAASGAGGLRAGRHDGKGGATGTGGATASGGTTGTGGVAARVAPSRAAAARRAPAVESRRAPPGRAAVRAGRAERIGGPAAPAARDGHGGQPRWRRRGERRPERRMWQDADAEEQPHGQRQPEHADDLRGQPPVLDPLAQQLRQQPPVPPHSRLPRRRRQRHRSRAVVLRSVRSVEQHHHLHRTVGKRRHLGRDRGHRVRRRRSSRPSRPTCASTRRASSSRASARAAPWSPCSRAAVPASSAPPSVTRVAV